MADNRILFCSAQEDQEIAQGFLKEYRSLGISQSLDFREEDLPKASVLVTLVPVVGAQITDLVENLKLARREHVAVIGVLMPNVPRDHLAQVAPYIDYIASETIYSTLTESLTHHLSQFYLEIPEAQVEPGSEPSAEKPEPKPRNRPLLETKMIVVGEGTVGKTSLINRILEAGFNPHEEITEGITIRTWSVKVSNNLDLVPNRDGSINLPVGPRDMKVLEDETVQVESEVDVHVNIWEFGGQEIMHATHQFFLTQRCLYLLVLDASLTLEKNRVEYWLKLIQTLGGESPLIIVGNKIDQPGPSLDLNALQKEYRNIVDSEMTSAATNEGVADLIQKIKQQMGLLRHVWTIFPEECFRVRAELELRSKKSNFITLDQYEDLCRENGLTEQSDQDAFIQVLHDLGAVLHFKGDTRLESLGILDPKWVTTGVYKIINSLEHSDTQGVLERSMLDRILNTSEYPVSKRMFIIHIMRKFELCYEIEADNTYRVPRLLPESEPPDLDFVGVPIFEYVYPILPSSIFARFIVRMNQHIRPGFVWRNGVVLQIEDNTLLVRANADAGKITISIGGREGTRQDALSVIRYELDNINTALKGLLVKKQWLNHKIPGIFISYARDDKERVEGIYQLLLHNNLYPWMDVYSIKGGEDWERAIFQAIEDCEFFLVVLSNNSVSRRGVIQKELKKALDNWNGMLPDDIYLIPIRIDDCPIPDLLRRFQMLDWDNGKGENKLLEAIRVGLSRRKADG